MKNWEMQFAELNLQIAFLGDFECVFHRFGNFDEARFHFLRRTQKKLLRHVARAHALGIAQQILRADAHEAIVRVRIAFVDVMNVVVATSFKPNSLANATNCLLTLACSGIP